MSVALLERARNVAAGKIAEHENCYLHSYPDARSEMADALGPGGCMQIALSGVIPAAVAHLKGDPWTCGIGATGDDITPTTFWSLQHARARFASDLQRFHDAAERAWPGTKLLHCAAQAALISIAFNRGTHLGRDPEDPIDRRRELRDLVFAVESRDYNRMAALTRASKRVWADEKQGGVLKRREMEAQLFEQAARETAVSA